MSNDMPREQRIRALAMMAQTVADESTDLGLPFASYLATVLRAALVETTAVRARVVELERRPWN